MTPDKVSDWHCPECGDRLICLGDDGNPPRCFRHVPWGTEMTQGSIPLKVVTHGEGDV